MGNKLAFGKGNAKLDKTILTFSLPAGHTCPGALLCLSRANKTTGKLTDGKSTKFRCFAASQECVYTNTRSSRWENRNMLAACRTASKMRDLILRSLSGSAQMVRIHVSGDFFSQAYFDAWLGVAKSRPETVFYAYTKSLPFWLSRIEDIPDNFRLTASRGGRHDDLIDKHDLVCAEVVFSVEEAERKGLEIDHDDSHAYSPDRKSFALLLHGQQPAGSEASAAIKELRNAGVKYSYGK